jgi:hypothetical protein
MFRSFYAPHVVFISPWLNLQRHDSVYTSMAQFTPAWLNLYRHYSFYIVMTQFIPSLHILHLHCSICIVINRFIPAWHNLYRHDSIFRILTVSNFHWGSSTSVLPRTVFSFWISNLDVLRGLCLAQLNKTTKNLGTVGVCVESRTDYSPNTNNETVPLEPSCSITLLSMRMFF